MKIHGLLFLFSVVTAYACTCVSSPRDKEPAADASTVFLGTVIESKLLPQRAEMKGRRRYEVRFRVQRYWKGDPSQMVTIYDLDPETDCQGRGFDLRREYLVYAVKDRAEDHKLDELFWFGWTDVLPEGTAMLVPMACTPTGKTSEAFVKTALHALGKGHIPARE